MQEFVEETALVANGNVSDDSIVAHRLKQFKRIIAVDGGLNHCHRLGILPDLIIGDFDSVAPGLLEQYPHVLQRIFSPDKDETDLELALKEVMADNEGVVTVFGGLGLRTDHTLANLHLLRRYPGRVVLEGNHERIFAIAGKGEIPCRVGQVMSLIPLGGPVRGVTTSGLRWDLRDAVLDKNFLSVSNECTENVVSVVIAEGDLLCCLQD